MPFNRSAMTMHTFKVFVYTENGYRKIPSGTDNRSEYICRELCKSLNFKPIVNLLFAVRIKGTNHYLSVRQHLKPNVKYEFRLRHQTPDLNELCKMDIAAFNYFYHQTKFDLVNDTIQELEYPNHKNDVAGLACTSMLTAILERDVSVEKALDQLSENNNYKRHVPAKLREHHGFRLKNLLFAKLREWDHTKRDASKEKISYLKEIREMAPSHFAEKYSGELISDDELCEDTGSHPIRLEVTPFDTKQPGLRFTSATRQTDWKHMAKIDDIYSVHITGDIVKIASSYSPMLFCVEISDTVARESFASCLTVYYRLMCKWTMSLCRELCSHALTELEMNRCHGPIGGEYAYRKLQQQNVGTYILRQCEKIHENYYIDIIVKLNHIKTFKITKENKLWLLHSQDGLTEVFEKLSELAMSIETESSRKFWMEPSENDTSPALLLCRSTSQLIAKKIINEHSENIMRENQALIFHANRDFRKYLHSRKNIENGIITQMRADWILPENKRLEVTLKELNIDSRMNEFMELGNLWSSLSSPELIKMYGFSFSPCTLVFESTKLGSFDEFMHKTNEPISVTALINVAHTLARALHYLHEKNLCHGRVRCSSLFVMKVKPPHSVTVRLGDPGLLKSYNASDKPWIPFEYHNNVEAARKDFKAEMWAYATTLWEIFSGGHIPATEMFVKGPESRRPPKPPSCPEDIYKLMKDGCWNERPDWRLSPQTLISKLIETREKQSNGYDTATIDSRYSNESTFTGTTIMYDPFSSLSYSQYPLEELDDDSPWPSNIDNTYDPRAPDYSESVVELEDVGNLIYKGEIGEGNYGSVFYGTIEYADESGKAVDVAIKRLKNIPDEKAQKDFKREIDIMRGLEHPNIVKIIASTLKPDILIVMEYVRHHSFLVYLSSHSPLLTTLHLLNFAKDIASGMAYLVSKKIVHRDLAARNILVDSMECVKISDFGLAQKTDSNGYYIGMNSRQIPMKWYAPESLRNNKYSHNSDAWSYGITLYEMFSRGQQPDLLPGKELQFGELLERLERGDRLSKPAMCPQTIYDHLLYPCWHKCPQSRPSFIDLQQIIDVEIVEHSVNDIIVEQQSL